MNRVPLLAVLTIIATLAADEPPPAGLSGSSNTELEEVSFEPDQWELVWFDEFEVDGVPDPDNWGYEVGYVRNKEAQFYTDDSQNAWVEDGNLIIEARLDPDYERGITSASLTTRGREDFLYGRIEARAMLPTGNGTWPAIWTLGANIGEVGWPQCGELDILENVGFDPMTLHANVHTGTFNHMKKNGRGNHITALEKPWEVFNVYAMEWYEDRVEFFFNDTRYLVVNRNSGDDEGSWPFDQPQYLILNLAIGGTWGGQQGIDEALFPHRLVIDFVRYFRYTGE